MKKKIKSVKVDEEGNALKNENGELIIEDQELDLVEATNTEVNNENTKEAEINTTRISSENNDASTQNEVSKIEILEAELATLKKQLNIERPIPRLENPNVEEEPEIKNSLGFDPLSQKIN